LLALQAVAAAYVLPAFWFGARALAPGSLADSYRKSAILVMGLLIAGWNFAYWLLGFYPRISRLCPEVQARTGAKVRFAFRSVQWDRPLDWGDRLSLQLHFLGLLVVSFLLWGLLLLATITVLAVMQDGPAGALAFFHR
jgi:hypothetical protein